MLFSFTILFSKPESMASFRGSFVHPGQSDTQNFTEDSVEARCTQISQQGKVSTGVSLAFNYSILPLFLQNFLLQLLNKHILSNFDQCVALVSREEMQIREHRESTSSLAC